ncbi:MAG: hypothetical protein ACRCZF_22595 [Gemmataceae bacterium]
MSTKLAKWLVFANLFIGFGLFTWSFSLYTNRLDYFDRKDANPPVDGLFSQLKKQIDELTATSATAQANFARRAEQARAMDAVREFRSDRLNAMAAQVRVGDDEKILFRQYPLIKSPLIPEFPELGLMPALTDVKPAVIPAAVKNTRNADLQGLGFLKIEMGKAVKGETDTILRIRESRKKLDSLNDEAIATQREVFAQKGIIENLKEQKKFLGDSQVNWDEQLKTLERRKTQLLVRLEQLGSSPKVSRAGN